MNIFELQRVDKRLETIGHGLRRVWVDDEDRTHFVVSWCLTVTILAHCFSAGYYDIGDFAGCPAVNFVILARDKIWKRGVISRAAARVAPCDVRDDFGDINQRCLRGNCKPVVDNEWMIDMTECFGETLHRIEGLVRNLKKTSGVGRNRQCTELSSRQLVSSSNQFAKPRPSSSAHSPMCRNLVWAVRHCFGPP